MLERGGRYLVMGAINPRQTFAMDPSIVIGRSLDIRGVALYRADVLKQGIEFIRRNKDRLPLGEMVNSYPFEEADMALEAAMNRATPGRVQLTFPS
jgi:D-arabinose 1-dehydrogenase-like Zn-dependent alcohol dehydrogenase